MKKDYIVFNMATAGYLMMRGFVLKRLERTNKGDKWRNIFIFNESEELLQAIQDYKNLDIRF